MITKLFYFGVQTLGGEGRGQEKFGQNPYFHFFFNDDLPYLVLGNKVSYLQHLFAYYTLEKS